HHVPRHSRCSSVRRWRTARYTRGPPDEPSRPGRRMSLVPVLTCTSVEEAATYRGVLESHGVPCVIQGEHHRSLLGMLGPYVEVRLLVPDGRGPPAPGRPRRPPAGGPGPEGFRAPGARVRARRLGGGALVLLGGPPPVPWA